MYIANKRQMCLNKSIIFEGGVRQFGAKYITGGNPVW